MPDGLYEQDVLVWAERQSALLRRLASGHVEPIVEQLVQRQRAIFGQLAG